MRNSKWAVSSLIFGVLAFPLSVLSGILAIFSGILALNSIGRHRGQLGGRSLAFSGIAFGALSFLLAPLYLIVALAVLRSVSFQSAPVVPPETIRAYSAAHVPPETIRAYSAADATITQDGVEKLESGWRLTAAEETVFKLFEYPLADVDQCVLTYRAQMRSENLEGNAYLEMWCRFPGQGEFFSRGLAQPITGTTDWASYETVFYLKAGQKPDLLKLNLVTQGAGTVFLKDIEILRTPLMP